MNIFVSAMNKSTDCHSTETFSSFLKSLTIGIEEVEPDANIIISSPQIEDINHKNFSDNVELIKGLKSDYGNITEAQECHSAVLLGYPNDVGSGGVYEEVLNDEVVRGISINNTPLNDIKLDSILLSKWDTPISLVVGDDILCESMSEFVPDLNSVVTNKSLGSGVSSHKSPNYINKSLRSEISNILSNDGFPSESNYPDLTLQKPYSGTVVLKSARYGKLIGMWPDVNRHNSVTVEYETNSIEDLYMFFNSVKHVTDF